MCGLMVVDVVYQLIRYVDLVFCGGIHKICLVFIGGLVVVSLTYTGTYHPPKSVQKTGDTYDMADFNVMWRILDFIACPNCFQRTEDENESMWIFCSSDNN